MALASGTRVRLLYIKEVTRGTTPSTPAMKVLRATGRNINLTKNMLESAEVRSDRMIADMRHGFNKIEGSPGFELGVSSFDDMLEGLLSGSWTAVTVTGTPNLQAVAASSKYVRAAGSWITDGFHPGDIIDAAGFTNAGNNVRSVVLAVTATDLTVDAALTDEASASGRTITFPGKRLMIGTTLNTYTFERQFLDINQYQVFRGVAVNTGTIEIKPEAIVSGTINLLGMSAPAMAGTTIANSVVAAATNAPLSSFDGSLYEGGVQIAAVTSMTLEINNGRTVQPVVGSKFTPDVFEGRARVTGKLSLMFANATMYNKFVNETSSSVFVKLADVNGTDFLNIVLPRLSYTSAGIDPPQEGPVMIDSGFTALLDSATGTSLAIQRSNAT